MSNYQIGISGIHAAQKALTIIGNNIANAATEGYHRQTVHLVPTADAYSNGAMIGQGVEYAGVIRKVDSILENEILRQESAMSSVRRQLEMLQSIESAFGELTTAGLSTAIDEFYAALHDLSLRPEDVNMQSEVQSKAQTLVTQMNNVSTMVANMSEMTHTESLSTIERVNLIAEQIATLNQEIYNQKMRGYDANNAMDMRDNLITELGRLVGVNTYVRGNGMVDVIAADISLVVGTMTTAVEIGLVEDGNVHKLGLRPTGSDIYTTRISGGVLGGLFELRNSIIRDLQDDLDTLAATLITETNKRHIQGVGQNGSFTNLAGWTISQTAISEIVPPVTPGTFHIRVIDASGDAVSYAVAIDADSTIEDVVNALAAIPGLSDSEFSGGRVHIVADGGYRFDFLPGVRTAPIVAVPLAGAGGGDTELPPKIKLSGNYIGATNQTYTFTVQTSPPGQTQAVGNGTMNLIVADGNGQTVGTINIGQGYTPGQRLAVIDGVEIELDINGISPGYLNDGESFEVEALVNSDPTGFLAAAGINCFFSGSSANSMDLTDYIKRDGRNIAVSGSPDLNDNSNAAKLAQLGDLKIDALGSYSIKEYYRQIAVGLGNRISVSQMQYDNIDGVQRSLSEQRDAISGVDINDQASLMMMFERMFQAMARYINTVTETQKTILTLVS